MDEEEFDSLHRWRPFGTGAATRADAQARRGFALGVALWGKNADDLRRQLLAPHPEIPPGYELADFRALEQSIRTLGVRLGDPRYRWMSTSSIAQAFLSPEVVVGTRRFTGWEARYEIIRRAIEYLEGR